MHDIKFFVENVEEVKINLGKRKFDTGIIDTVLKMNDRRKVLIQEVESSRAETKKLSKEVGMLKRDGKDASELMAKVGEIKQAMSEGDAELESTIKNMDGLLATIPNLIDSEVPSGADESDNIEVHSWGEIPQLDFEAKDHADLGESLGMLDFDCGAKITGARFVVYRGHLARLERALINFMLDYHTNDGYEEIIPPFIVNSESMYGTGQLPKFAEDAFKIDGRDWYLIPTAEVPVTNMKRGELFEMNELPLRYAAYTPCFRSEAGSHGKDTKGLIRLHQFNKVEMVNIVAPDKSEETHQAMVKRACTILEMLKLPYRSMLLCAGDIGFGARKCYDLEVWLPSQMKYREISSISNCGEFQARRASIRYRGEDKKPVFAHTLNGSGLAVGRTVVAIMENYQNSDGTITIPEVLRPYMGGLEQIG
ncbi:MAG: serine--tRNA ligase [Bacteriovoracaceae bacterium]|nr:serine--tRNA ligase [Bacteriovoracaceae bacterium]